MWAKYDDGSVFVANDDPGIRREISIGDIAPYKELRRIYSIIKNGIWKCAILPMAYEVLRFFSLPSNSKWCAFSFRVELFLGLICCISRGRVSENIKLSKFT